MTATKDQTSLDGIEESEPSVEQLVAKEVARIMGNSQPDLPPNAFRSDSGRYLHTIKVMTEGGTIAEQTRPLATSLEEAIANRWDYYHPTLGLIYEGYKLARDRDAKDIMGDSSESRMRPEGAAELARLQTAGSGA